jgi:hypothetical protein
MSEAFLVVRVGAGGRCAAGPFLSRFRDGGRGECSSIALVAVVVSFIMLLSHWMFVVVAASCSSFSNDERDNRKHTHHHGGVQSYYSHAFHNISVCKFGQKMSPARARQSRENFATESISYGHSETHIYYNGTWRIFNVHHNIQITKEMRPNQ